MAEDLVVGFTTIESLKRCFSQVGKELMFVTFVSLNFFNNFICRVCLCHSLDNTSFSFIHQA